DGANKACEMLAEAREKGDFTRIAALEHALAFNLSGHVLHSLFWQNLSPDGGGTPGGELGQAIERDFGDFKSFRQQMIKAAEQTMGSGWAALVWDPLSSRLFVALYHDHQSETIQGSIPLLVLDAWEHAYYAQYANEKTKFFEAVWNVWNWEDVAKRFAEVQQSSLLIESAAAASRSRAAASRERPAGRA